MNKRDRRITEDLEMICVSCNKRFIFTIGEQEYYREHGLTFPKRCKDCRGKNRRKKRVPTIIGKKNPIKEGIQDHSKGTNKQTIARSKENVANGRRCEDCSIGGTDRCPRPIHKNSDTACDEFISKEILPEDMKKNFPTQGKATRLKYGKAGKSQFERAKHESE